MSYGNPDKGKIPSGLLSAAVAAALLASVPAVAEDSGRSFEFYGFAQADYIQDIGGRLDPDWDDAFRPSKKICFDNACGEDGQSSISVKQSRFGVKGTMPTGTRAARHSTSSSSSTCSAPASMRARRRCACAISMASGARFWPVKPIACSWTSTCSRTRSTTGARRAWCSTDRQECIQPYRTDNSHFAVAIERPSNDIDPGNLRLIPGLEGLEVNNDEELPDFTAGSATATSGGISSSAASCARSAMRFAASNADAGGGPRAARPVGVSTSVRCSTCWRKMRFASRSSTARASPAT